jgi:DNA polymerase I
VLEDPAIGKLGQNLKYDRIVLRPAGVELRGEAFDTMVASYLLDAGQRNHTISPSGICIIRRSRSRS